ncbi:hypothetical protein BFP97_04365 [Roseivirga sp. 4D4]|uniref:ABC transporter permease n=1 Tax=Roseivirga sp. 4D4 TaxID=1889784 RepID=UPI000853793B|nr:ABC transporter permease [Roseivirga sp. 4D4]OEK00787.1 hypothetical protein BFP97_04365 [Roseivirga sp. 4D4]
MLKNYITTTFRFFWKNKSYSLINLLGLSIGMSCFILLSLFVRKEFSYDQYHEDKDLIYQVYLSDTSSSRSDYAYQTMAPMAPLFKETVPEVTEAIRFGRMNNRVIKLKTGIKYQADEVYYTDESVFDFFSIRLLAGSSSSVLASGDHMAISEEVAIRMFGTVEEAISETIEIVDFGALTVSGVFENLPDNTHLDFDYLISFENADKAMAHVFGPNNAALGADAKSVMDWGTVSAFPVYLKLRSDLIDIENVELSLQSALAPHRPSDLVKLVPLTEIYFSELNKGYFGRKGEESNARLYLIIAFIILGVAIVNYMNMATARHSKRAKEVGIRKTVGGHRMQIAKQFFLESTLMAFISLLLAICFTEMALPTLNGFIGKDLALAYDSPLTYMTLALFTVLISFLSGIYPSIFLSKFSPIQMLTGRVSGGKGGAAFRKVLVGFQFFVCLSLIAITSIVYSQFSYMQNMDLGIEEDQIIGVSMRDTNLQKSYPVFKDRLLSNASISAVTGVSYSVFKGNMSVYAGIAGMEESQPVSYMSVESNFLNTLGIKVNTGQSFADMDESAVTNALLINETAAEKFGWDNPLEEKIFQAPITGVVDDFIYGSAKTAIAPMVMMTSKEGFSQAYIKINGANVKEAVNHVQSVFEDFSIDYPFEYKFLDDHFAEMYEGEKRLSDIFSIFSLLAIFIAGLGIFGLSIFMAEQRIKEIGIRKVLGAGVGHIIWVMNNGVTKLMVVVAIITLPLVYHFMSLWLSDFAFHITLNGILLVAPLLVLTLIVWSILMFQSYKSARTNPINALRTD